MPVGSVVGRSCTPKTVPLVPSETTTSPGPMFKPSAAAMLSPLPAETTMSPTEPTTSAGPATRGSETCLPSARSTRSSRYSPVAGDQ